MKIKIPLIIASLITSGVLCLFLIYPAHANDMGEKIVYTTYYTSEGNDSELHIMDSDGTNDTRLTTNDDDEYNPAISSDGTKIAFTVYDNTTSEEGIYTMNIDGSNRKHLTVNLNDDFRPSWSPDGSKIAFNSYRTGQYEIFIMNADGSNQTQITNNAPGGNSAENPTWSPDGTRIAFDDSSNIYTMNADGSSKLAVPNAHGTNPTWSPDGTKIAYETFSFGKRIIRLIDTDGNNMVDVTDNSVDSTGATWSPDGTRIAYAESGNIMTISIDGSNKTPLTNGSGNNSSVEPSWSITAPTTDPDGIDSATESAAPNGGDANNDGLQDSTQANVSSFVNPVTNSYVSVQSSCASNSNVGASAESWEFKDAGFDYPTGFVGFTLGCGSLGATASVVVYFFSPPANTLVRKYNSNTHTYQAIEGASLQNLAIGGQSALKVSYSVTDGGALDQDQVVNGSIVDPVGLGQIVAAAPRTGMGGAFSLLTVPFL